MGKTRVLITDGMADNGLQVLKQADDIEIDVRKKTDPDTLAQIISNYECIVIRSATTLTGELIKKASAMKLIVRAGAGVDNIDVPTATEAKIPVMNTASANALAAAEQTIALLFAMMRHIPQSAASLKAEKWERANFKGYEVTGRTLGVVGLGAIGQLVAERAIGLGMQVLGYDPTVQSLSQLPPKLARQEESLALAKDLQGLLPKVDVLSLHVPKMKQTMGLIGAAELALMKEGSFLINCARGGVVDEEAVIRAVDEGRLTSAAFDVFAKEPPEFPNKLVQHDKIVTVPHLGASTHEAQARVASTAASQIIDFFHHGKKTGVVNL